MSVPLFLPPLLSVRASFVTLARLKKDAVLSPSLFAHHTEAPSGWSLFPVDGRCSATAATMGVETKHDEKGSLWDFSTLQPENFSSHLHPLVHFKPSPFLTSPSFLEIGDRRPHPGKPFDFLRRSSYPGPHAHHPWRGRDSTAVDSILNERGQDLTRLDRTRVVQHPQCNTGARKARNTQGRPDGGRVHFVESSYVFLVRRTSYGVILCLVSLFVCLSLLLN